MTDIQEMYGATTETDLPVSEIELSVSNRTNEFRATIEGLPAPTAGEVQQMSDFLAKIPDQLGSALGSAFSAFKQIPSSIINQVANGYTKVVDNIADDSIQFVKENKIPEEHENSIIHVRESALLTNQYGSQVSTQLADVKEIASFNKSEQYPDSRKDQWNNEVGRQISDWVKSNKHNYPKLNDEQITDKLILDAYNAEAIALDEKDPRINNPAHSITGAYRFDVGWKAPSQETLATLRRDDSVTAQRRP